MADLERERSSFVAPFFAVTFAGGLVMVAVLDLHPLVAIVIAPMLGAVAAGGHALLRNLGGSSHVGELAFAMIFITALVFVFLTSSGPDPGGRPLGAAARSSPAPQEGR